MVGLISLFIIVVMSLLVTRVATVMLTLTGLSAESAKFQARSAFSGAGFTTSESEAVVNHPVRRRIIMTLVLLGNAGIVTVVGSLLLSFSGVTGSVDAAERLGLILGGLIVLWFVARSRLLDRMLSGVIERVLRRYTDLDARDYVAVLRLAGAWVVSEMEIRDGDWLCDVPLRDLALPEEGVLVLGIDRSDGRWVGAPSGKASLHAGDVAVVYGTREAVRRLDGRRRDPEGEMDRLASQVEFTEKYLEQQELERRTEAGATAGAEPAIAVGEDDLAHVPATDHGETDPALPDGTAAGEIAADVVEPSPAVTTDAVDDADEPR